MLPEILKAVHTDLVKDVPINDFFERCGKRTADIKINDTTISVGIKDDNSAMVLTLVDDNKTTRLWMGSPWKITFEIKVANMDSDWQPKFWAVELNQDSLKTMPGDFDFIVKHMVAVNHIMTMIKNEEEKFLFEKKKITEMLDKHKGKRRNAAEELGISERTLYYKMMVFELRGSDKL